MSKNLWLVVLSLLLGLSGGLLLNRVASPPTVSAQNAISQSNQILVRGNARAISHLTPPGETFALNAETTPQRSFTVVPAGKKFVLTDVIYQAQASVQQPMTVNIASANLSVGKQSILFQTTVEPMKSEQVHLCSGYVIPEGHSLVAYTGRGLEREQYVSISVTGYLIDQ